MSVWGKGGVGKSTVAAALGLLYAGRGLRTLVVSTDPTPAVARLLCGGEVGRRGACGGVDVIELSDDDVVDMWRARFGDEVYSVASSFLPVDRSIVEYVARAPGIADEFTLYYVYELVGGGAYDVVIWDTTGAGGSLALLRLERELYEHMGEAARLYLRVRSTLERLRRGQRDPLELIDSWRELAKEMLELLASDSHRLLLVSEATRLSFQVTRGVLDELRSYGMSARAIVVNKVVRRGACPGCHLVEEMARECEEALGLFEGIEGVRKVVVPYIERAEERVKGVAAALAASGLP